MPKRRKPFWNKHSQQWEAWIYNEHGKRTRAQLGIRARDDEPAAWAAFSRLTGERTIQVGPQVPIREVFAHFLLHVESTGAPSYKDWHQRYLKAFAAAVGGLTPVGDIRPYHLTKWVDDAYPPPKSQHHPKRAIKAAFTWATSQGIIDANPLAAVKIGKPGRLGESLTVDQRALLLETSHDEHFRRLLTALEHTGCRVQEIRAVESRHVLRDSKGLPIAWVFGADEHKTGKKRSLPRVIPLSGSAATITDQLCKAHPEGPLFRNRDGNPWTSNAIRCRFRRRRENKANKGKFPKRLRGTHYRHTLATDLSGENVNLDLIRQLTGHADLSMLLETYLHSHGIEKLREELKKARD